MENCK